MRQFYGIERLRGGGEEDLTYLVLEDLTQGMRRPCVMDIKIGARTYGPDASPAKVRQEDSKYLGTKKPLGMQRWNSWTLVYQKTRVFCSMLFTDPSTPHAIVFLTLKGRRIVRKRRLGRNDGERSE